MSDLQNNFDVLIVGGGIVGLTLGCALGNSRLKIGVVDAHEPGDVAQDDPYELRVSAISRASQQVFMNLHAWEGMKSRRISPFEHMHVWDATGAGMIHFDAAEQGVDALGHIIENKVTQAALLDQLKQLDNVQWICPATVKEINYQPEQSRLVLEDGRRLCGGPRHALLQEASVARLMSPPAAALAELPAPQPRPYALEPGAALLELHDVSVAYGETRVLQQVSWTFARGQHCAVAGPNGCGKTTLLSLVTGDNHKAYGQDITLFGRRRGSGESVWDIKQKYGQVDTQLHLSFARGMKVVEVVVSGFFDTIGLYDDWGDRQRELAGQWLAALGLAGYERDSFDALSFGLQRMVLLARAMVKSPVILLLDEPTLGLDGHHRRLILRAIDHIAANSDTRIIFVSHSAGETPACINQHVVFEPRDEGFVVVCR